MAVTGITLRNVKGSELTFTEMDNNFSNLKSAIESLQTVTNVTVDTNQTITGLKTFNTDVQLKGIRETVYDHGTVNGNVVVDASYGSVHKMTINGAITINSLTNAVTGSNVTIFIKQDGTGGRTLSSTALFPDGYKVLSTASNAIDVITLFYDGTQYFGNIARGFA